MTRGNQAKQERQPKKVRHLANLEPDVGRALSVAWSPEGTRLAVAGKDGLVVLTARGRPLWEDRRVDSFVYSVAWSPDGSRIARSGQRSALRVHHAESGDVLAESSAPTANALSWSPEGQVLAAGGDDRRIHVYEGATLRELQVRSGHTRILWDVSWSPDGRRIASASEDCTVRIWEPEREDPIFEGVEHRGWVYQARWSPDGRVLASASSDRTVCLWEGRFFEPLELLIDEQRASFRSVAWAPDSRHLATGTEDGEVVLWDVASMRLLGRLASHGHAVHALAFSSDGAQLASAAGDGKVCLWDTADLLKRRAPATAYKREPFDEDERPSWENTKGGGDGCLGGVEIDQLCGGAGAVAFSGDGYRLFVGGPGGSLQAMSVARGVVGWERSGLHRGALQSLALSPEGERLASTGEDGIVRILASDDGSLLCQAKVCEGAAPDVCWSPDGQRLAVACRDRHVRVIAAPSGREILTMPAETDANTIAWSPDGTLLASGHDDGSVLLWDAAMVRLRRLFRHRTRLVWCVRWSPDGRVLASAGYDGSIWLWDPLSSGEPRRLTGRSTQVNHLAWSPDGLRLAAGFGSGDRTVRIWNARTGAAVITYRLPEQWTWRLAWSPGGALLASSHDAGVCRLWSTRSDEERAR